MSLLKIKLLIVSAIMFAASSAFASLGYDINVNTTDLNGTDGYIYLQYKSGSNQTDVSTASVLRFHTDGILGATAGGFYDNSGTYVIGALPGTVSLSNGTLDTNDYNQAINFGHSFSFHLELPDGSPLIAGSDFSLWLAADAAGGTPLRTADGKLLEIALNADGTALKTVYDAGTFATPIPAAAWLMGSGLFGLVGLKRRKNG